MMGCNSQTMKTRMEAANPSIFVIHFTCHSAHLAASYHVLPYVVFNLGTYIKDHFGVPVKYLTWGNIMEVELELYDPSYVLQYCFFRSPNPSDTAHAKSDNPVIEYGPDVFLAFININDLTRAIVPGVTRFTS